MRETYQLLAASPAGPPRDRTPGATALTPAVDGNRHNATESDEPQRKLVPARTRARQQRSASVLSAQIGFDASLGVAVS